MKHVLWKRSDGTYCFTRRSNYYSYVQSVKEIKELEAENTEQAIEEMHNMYGIKYENIEFPMY